MLRIASVAVAAFCLSTASAFALDVSVGGINASIGGGANGGLNANASVSTIGNTQANVNATIGGADNVAKADANASTGLVGGRTDANVAARIGSGGANAGVAVGSNSLGGNTAVNVSIGLGGSRGGGNGGGGNGGGGPGLANGGGLGGAGGPTLFGRGDGGTVPTQVIRYYSGLDSNEQVAMKKKCGSILQQPSVYDDGLVSLCRMLRRI